MNKLSNWLIIFCGIFELSHNANKKLNLDSIIINYIRAVSSLLQTMPLHIFQSIIWQSIKICRLSGPHYKVLDYEAYHCENEPWFYLINFQVLI